MALFSSRRVLGQQHDFDLAFQIRHARLQFVELHLGQLAHLPVQFGIAHRNPATPARFRRRQRLNLLHDGSEVGKFFRETLEFLRVHPAFPRQGLSSS